MSGAVAGWVEVVLDVAQLESALCYRIPAHLTAQVGLGTPVKVPLGRRIARGYVVNWVDNPPDQLKIKDILGVEEHVPPLGEDMLQLIAWMQRRYFCSPGAALRTALPRQLQTGKKRVQRLVRLNVPPAEAREWAAAMAGKAPKQARLLLLLSEQAEHGQVPLPAGGKDRTSLQALDRKGLISFTQHDVYRQSYAGLAAAAREVRLTTAQEKAVEELAKAMAKGDFRPFLLYGVTASGKTEVYLQLVKEVVQRGKQCLLLVPEIFLVPQMLEQLRSRFGADKVAVWHSSLSEGERYDAWRRIARGEAPVVVGARSAAFAPVPRLGLVIMDEEQEPSYKEEHGIRYHAREVVLKRAQLARAVLVLGTATPSLETYYRAKEGQYSLIYLKERVTPHGPPPVKLIDMRAERRRGNFSILSSCLQEQMGTAIRQGEQIILLVNRRGYYSYLLCQECGFVWRCPHCDVSLTYHRTGGKQLRCHYCGFSLPFVATCPHCGSSGWRGQGIGTQQVEAEVARTFSGVTVLRVDRDAVGRKEARQQYYEAFRQGRAAVLVGTQMVAQGLDFPGVTLVGVVDADTQLNLPDFRARERTFQLMTQVAGRAGRGNRPGEVVLQTYRPEDSSLQAVAGGKAATFYAAEGQWRKKYGYPPFTRLARLILMADNWDTLQESVIWLGGLLRERAGENVEVLGPTPAPLSRVKDNYRWQVIIKGLLLSEVYRVIQSVKDAFRQRYSRSHGPKLLLDIEPQNMF